jgi:murein DD-endopeptidase MepM/ murein hydrolase activator NlpD
MAPFRNPVVDGKLPVRLPCMDIDPATGARIGDTCKRKWEKYQGDSFNCPKGCSKASFLYPRKPRSNGKDFHFHQGIDIGWQEHAQILSVTSGKVIFAENEYRSGWSHYGKFVVVQANELPYYFLYAHCASICVSKHQEVQEGQLIGTVGRTFYSAKSPTYSFPKGPHLHFEVITKLGSTAPGTETQLGEDMSRRGGTDQPRLDPLYILEKLGPWGMREVYLPNGDVLTRTVADPWHKRIESSPSGGFFPLGANNHWHGGVHLPAPLGTKVVAPFDATIVAARLDPDPAHAFHPGAGHSNFILLRHEIAEDCHALFQGKDPADIEVKPTSKPKPKSRAVGKKSHCANQPADVVAVKHALHAHRNPAPYYGPAKAIEPTEDGYAAYLDELAELDSPETSKELEAAIKAFQEEKVGSISPDGVVDIPGKTWSALHDGNPPKDPPPDPIVEPPPERPLDPTRVVYSLLMHLQPLPLTDATAKDFAWLGQVKLSPNLDDPAEVEAADTQRVREDDLAEAKHDLSGSVGADAKNAPSDVRWVSKRLVRFGYHLGPVSDVCDEALITAIVALQNEHHPSFKKKQNGDGRVDTKGDTRTLLHRTRASLRGDERTGDVDPVLLHRATVRDTNDLAKVLTGLDIKVRSGDPLWRSGQAVGTTPDGSSVTMLDQIHWELFSEHLLVSGWEPPIEDPSEDLTADVPERIIAMIDSSVPELAHDYVFQPQEIQAFYASDRARFLRRTPCRFVSHWGLDVRKAVDRLEYLGFDITGVAEQLRPFMWWDQAADVLPPMRFVWHYNPVEFLGQYAEHLKLLRPDPPDPATHPMLQVRVLFDNGVPMPDQKVLLYQGIDVIRSARTGDDGIARFSGVAVGQYGARLDEPPTAMVPLEMVPNETTDVTIATDVPGPPLPRGSIHVTVREHTINIAGSVEVWLTHATAGPVMGDTTRFGKRSFEDIVYGDYIIEAGDAEPVAVTLDSKSRKALVTLPPPMGKLRVKVEMNGDPVARREVEILGESGVVASALTGADGIAELELRHGRYKARVGDAMERVRVDGDDPKPYPLELTENQLPDDDGALVISVRQGDGSPALTELVMVSGADYFKADFPDKNGVAGFVVPPGDYTIEVDDQSTAVTVYPSNTRFVQMQVGM